MSRRKQANPKPIKVLDEASEETDATGGCDVTNMLVTSDGEVQEQHCDGYDDDMGPLVIDTTPMSPERGPLKADWKKHEHSEVHEPLHDLDINQQDSLNQHTGYFDESTSQNDALNSTTGTPGNASWSSSSGSPSDLPKNKNGGRLISPSKTRRKSDKIQPLTTHSGEEKYVCPICKHVVTNSHELTRHIRSHNNTAAVTAANTCTICGKALSSQSSLDRHMLVHSGERPFQCHFCPMSFTTNGNMHRHMRIHEKDATAEPTTALLLASRPRSKQKILIPELMPTVNEAQLKKSSTSDSTDGTTKDTANVTSETGVVATAAVQVKQEPVAWDTIAMDYELAGDSDRGDDDGEYLMYENQVEPLASSAYRKLQLMFPVQTFDAMTSLKPGETLPCPACDRSFYSVYGIEAHLSDAHPDYLVPCPTCGVTFKSDIAQQRHQLQKHSAWMSKLAASHRDGDAHVPIGFHQLSFTAFSCAQFPLVAKAWCELRQRCTSSDTHSFTCRRCQHAFPCYAALELHAHTHAPELSSTCLKCDCNFATITAYDDHMTLHSRDNVMAGYTRMDGGDDNLVQDAVSQDEFLLLLNLKSNTLASREPAVAADGETGAKRSRLGPQVEGASSGQLVSRFHDLMTQTKDATKFGANTDIRKAMSGAVSRVMNSGLRNIAMANGSGCAPQQKTIDDMLERDRKEGGGILACNCCDLTFTNIRAYKGHVRAHLGLSPYKCDKCSYSSADKSTLVRHLRTHNGERPFQCLICEFAFTTKANCERHVRKKHDCQSKEEFEQAIGYNRYMTESPLDVKAFQSPDTVCKYCGEDFKFFRALKHHLRSHSSCQHKPFTCRLCHNGFSTKANCVRHVQKQHVEITVAQMDQYIHVNENLPNRSLSRCQEGAVVFDKDDTHSESSMSPLPGRSLKVSSQLFGASAMKHRRAPVASDMLSEDGDGDEPLDFSMKASSTDDMNSRDASYCDSVVSVESQDQPIDLTLHGRPETAIRPSGKGGMPAHLQSSSILAKHVSSPLSGAVGMSQILTSSPIDLPMYLQYSDLVPSNYAMLRYKKEYQQFYNPVLSRLECPFCAMPFKHGLKLIVHIRSHTNERPYNCPLCSVGFTIKTNLDRHLKTKHPDRLDLTLPDDTSSRDTSVNEGTDDDDDEGDDDDDDDVMLVSETNNNIAKLSNGQGPSPSNGQGPSPSNSYGSDCDLSSVNRILDATDGVKLHALLRPTPSDGASTAAEGDDDSQQSRALLSSPEPPAYPSKVTVSDVTGGSAGDTAMVDDDQPPTKKKRNSYADSPHKLQCPYCPRAFPWISSLKRHLLTHTGQKPFKCPQCPVTFSTKSNRERHMVRKHGLDIHDPATRQMMDRPYKCHLCVFSSFSTASNLLKHYREKHENADIPDDLIDTANNGTVNTSLLSAGGSTDQMSAVVALCQSIDSQDNMSSVSEMSESRQSAGLEFEEEEDMEPEAMEEGLGKKLQELSSSSLAPAPSPGGSTAPTLSPLDGVDTITECWYCAARFATRRALLHHMKEHGSTSDLPYKCYLCDASYDARRLILEHTIKSHPRDWAALQQKNNVGNDISGFLAEMSCAVTEIESEADKGSGGGQPVESDYAQRKVHCALCPKRFWSLQDLRRHMRSHTGERPFKCDLCEKTFTLKHSMLRHRTRHTRNGGTASDEEGATSSAVNKTDAIATMNGHVHLLDRKRRIVTLAANTSIADGDVPLKATKGRQSLSLATPPGGATHQVAAGDNSNDSDMLQNLLGVENAAIEQMLNSADSAAQLLGVD